MLFLFHDYQEETTCYTYAKVETLYNVGDDYTGTAEMKFKSCDRSELDTSCKEEGVEYTNVVGLDVFGSMFVKSFEECAMLCRDLEACTSFTYTTAPNWGGIGQLAQIPRRIT